MGCNVLKHSSTGSIRARGTGTLALLEIHTLLGLDVLVYTLSNDLVHR